MFHNDDFGYNRDDISQNMEPNLSGGGGSWPWVHGMRSFRCERQVEEFRSRLFKSYLIVITTYLNPLLHRLF